MLMCLVITMGWVFLKNQAVQFAETAEISPTLDIHQYYDQEWGHH